MEHRRGESCWLHPRESSPEVDQGPGKVITSPTMFGSVLLRNQRELPKVAENREVFRVLLQPMFPENQARS